MSYSPMKHTPLIPSPSILFRAKRVTVRTPGRPQAMAWKRRAFFSMASLPHLGTAARNQVIVNMTHHTLPAMVKKYRTMKNRVHAWERKKSVSNNFWSSANLTSIESTAFLIILTVFSLCKFCETAGRTSAAAKLENTIHIFVCLKEMSNLVVWALCYGWSSKLRGADCITRYPVFQQEPQEKHQRHHDITHSVEDDWTLRVSKPNRENKSCWVWFSCSVITVIHCKSTQTTHLVTSMRNVRKVKSVADRQTIEMTPMKYRMKVSSCWLKNIEGHGAEQSFLPMKV